MPTVTLNYKTVKQSLGKLSDEQLKEYIAMIGTGLESMSKEGIVVEVFPNRPDLLAEFGFIRAMRAFLDIKPGLAEYKAKPSGKRVIIKSSVSKIRPYTACAIVGNLHLDDERLEQLIQLQEKLHVTFCRNRKKGAIGIYPSDKLRYPIEFFAEEPSKVSFVPLGETRKMNGLQILSKHKTGREYGHLLEGREKFPFFRDSAGEILSMPPIINSEFTGKVTSATREVFVECSGFDLSFLKKLLNIVVCEMADMGGEILSMELTYPDCSEVTPELKAEKMRLDEGYVHTLLGQKVNIKKCLGRMGHGYSGGVASVPCYRVDVLHMFDLVEDIAIGHGYSGFEAELPNISTPGEECRIERFKRSLSELAVGQGLSEVFTFNATSDKLQNEMMGTKGKIIPFSNSKSSEQSGLRRSMLPCMLEVLATNANNEYPQRIFDIGTLFSNGKSETGIIEEEYLSVALAGEDFTNARQVLERMLRGFGITATFKQLEGPEFIPGRAGEIQVNGKPLGRIGEIHPQVILNFKLGVPVAAFELNISKLIDLIK